MKSGANEFQKGPQHFYDSSAPRAGHALCPCEVQLEMVALALVALAALPPLAAAVGPQCSTASKFPASQRIACGDSTDRAKSPMTASAARCAARGCCWGGSAAPAPPPPPALASEGGCLTGKLSTPAAGVKDTTVWSQHVPFSNPAGFRVEVEIAGFVHNGKKLMGHGPWYSTRNLTVSCGFWADYERLFVCVPAAGTLSTSPR